VQSSPHNDKKSFPAEGSSLQKGALASDHWAAAGQ